MWNLSWAGAGRGKCGCSLGREQGGLAGAHPAWWTRGRDMGEDKGENAASTEILHQTTNVRWGWFGEFLGTLLA